MSAVTDATTVLNTLSGKSLSPAQLLSIGSNYNWSFGDAWSVEANPHDPNTNPVDYSAWPDNATGEQVAQFLLDVLLADSKKRLRVGRRNARVHEELADLNSAESEL